MSKQFKPQDRVCYEPKHGKAQWGTVSSVNEKYVFVRFDEQVSRLGWEGATSKACLPSQIRK